MQLAFSIENSSGIKNWSFNATVNFLHTIDKFINTSVELNQIILWKTKAQAMEKAFASGNNRTLFHLVRSIGPRKQNVSETITEKNGSMIYSLERRLERWAEHFEEQFNQPAANASILGIPEAEWSVNT